MCGRTTLTLTPDDLKRSFGFPVPAGYRPRFNIAPSQELLAISDRGEGPGFVQLRWGLVPFWAGEASIGNRMINARCETVATKPAFRGAFAKRRCLVVVDGYYEWQATAAGKRPHRFRLRSGAPFTLAGLWERWDRGAAPLDSCTIITTTATDATAPIHDRMPVIIGPEEREAWLAAEADPESLRSLLRPYAGDDLEGYEVSTLVNSPSNDRSECIDPVAAEEIDLFGGGHPLSAQG